MWVILWLDSSEKPSISACISLIVLRVSVLVRYSTIADLKPSFSCWILVGLRGVDALLSRASIMLSSLLITSSGSYLSHHESSLWISLMAYSRAMRLVSLVEVEVVMIFSLSPFVCGVRLPLFTCLLYHTLKDLSRGFENFFEVFFGRLSLSLSP